LRSLEKSSRRLVTSTAASRSGALLQRRTDAAVHGDRCLTRLEFVIKNVSGVAASARSTFMDSTAATLSDSYGSLRSAFLPPGSQPPSLDQELQAAWKLEKRRAPKGAQRYLRGSRKLASFLICARTSAAVGPRMISIHWVVVGRLSIPNDECMIISFAIHLLHRTCSRHQR
jgi:hypothetical protein